MTKSFPPARRIQLLLNALVGEKHLRRPLLRELIDELAADDQQANAIFAGRALLDRLESGIDQSEYQTRVSQLYELTTCTHEAPQSPTRRSETSEVANSRD